MKNEKITMHNLKKMIKESNKSLTSLAVSLGVSREAISQYISGKINPKLKTVVDMAKMLNTSTDYLLDLTDNPIPNDFKLNEKELNLIKNYQSLSESEKIKVDAYIDAIMDLKKI